LFFSCGHNTILINVNTLSDNQSYHLTLTLAVDVVAAYLSAGGLGGFTLAVLSLDLCHTECKSIDTKKDRHDGRSVI